MMNKAAFEANGDFLAHGDLPLTQRANGAGFAVASQSKITLGEHVGSLHHKRGAGDTTPAGRRGRHSVLGSFRSLRPRPWAQVKANTSISNEYTTDKMMAE